MKMTQLPLDLVASVIRFFPVERQYPMAVCIFQKKHDWVDEFLQKKEYIDSAVSHVYNDVVSLGFCHKFGKVLLGESKLSISFKTKILQFDLPHVPTQGLHKIPVWKSLGSSVSPYFLEIAKTVETELEIINVKLVISSQEHSGKFFVTLEVVGHENNQWGLTFLEGVKDVVLDEPQDIWLAQGLIIDEKDGYHGTSREYEDGTHVVFQDLPGCTFDDYKFGFSKEEMRQLLF